MVKLTNDFGYSRIHTDALGFGTCRSVRHECRVCTAWWSSIHRYTTSKGVDLPSRACCTSSHPPTRDAACLPSVGSTHWQRCPNLAHATWTRIRQQVMAFETQSGEGATDGKWFISIPSGKMAWGEVSLITCERLHGHQFSWQIEDSNAENTRFLAEVSKGCTSSRLAGQPFYFMSDA